MEVKEQLTATEFVDAAKDAKHDSLPDPVEPAFVPLPDQSYDDFVKFDIRVGIVVSAEKIKKKDRLLKLEVDLGPEIGMRTIVAGIAEFYNPNDLQPHNETDEMFGYVTSVSGKSILVVTNLAPRKVGGIMSHGMLLAGKDKTDLYLATCPNLPAGTKIG